MDRNHAKDRQYLVNFGKLSFGKQKIDLNVRTSCFSAEQMSAALDTAKHTVLLNRMKSYCGISGHVLMM